MLRYLVLLAAGLYVALLVGGRDTGQERFGLAGAYDPPPPVPLTAAASRAEEPVTLATFTPEAPQAAPTAPAPVTAAAAAPEPAPLPEPVPAPVAEAPAPQVLWVASGTVNLREGPSTETAVLGKLRRDEAVTVVAEAADGWLRVRLEGDGGEGFVAARFLTDVDPTAN